MIHFTNLKVDNIKQASGVFSGENHQTNWRDYKNVKEGFGAMIGNENEYTKGKHAVIRAKPIGKKEELEDENDQDGPRKE